MGIIEGLINKDKLKHLIWELVTFVDFQTIKSKGINLAKYTQIKNSEIERIASIEKEAKL